MCPQQLLGEITGMWGEVHSLGWQLKLSSTFPAVLSYLSAHLDMVSSNWAHDGSLFLSPSVQYGPWALALAWSARASPIYWAPSLQTPAGNLEHAGRHWASVMHHLHPWPSNTAPPLWLPAWTIHLVALIWLRSPLTVSFHWLGLQVAIHLNSVLCSHAEPLLRHPWLPCPGSAVLQSLVWLDPEQAGQACALYDSPALAGLPGFRTAVQLLKRQWNPAVESLSLPCALPPSLCLGFSLVQWGK